MVAQTPNPDHDELIKRARELIENTKAVLEESRKLMKKSKELMEYLPLSNKKQP